MGRLVIRFEAAETIKRVANIIKGAVEPPENGTRLTRLAA